MLTHLRPLVCVPFAFRQSRLVLSVARFLLVQARVRRDERGAFCKRKIILAHRVGATGQNYNKNSKSNRLRIRKIFANVDQKFSSCDKNRDHLRGHDRNLESETLTRQSAFQTLKKGTREIVRQKSNSLREGDNGFDEALCLRFL